MNERQDYILQMGINQEQEAEQRLEAQKVPPTLILDNLSSYPGEWYGCKEPSDLLDNFVTNIIQDRHSVHLLLAGGESGNGKSRTLDEMLMKMLFLDVKKGKSETRLSQFIREQGLTLRLHSIPWGDASEHLEPEWMIDEKADYRSDPILHKGKQREVNYAEDIMGTAIAETIKECNDQQKAGKKYLDIIIGDVPVSTGDMIDGKPVGILRAYSMMQKIRHKVDKFRGLGYKLSFFMQSASTDVREEAFADRGIISNEALSEEQKIAELAKRGKVFTPDQSVKDAAQEPATPDQMLKVQADVNDVIIALHARADPRMRPGSRYDHEITEEMLNGRPTQLRVPMIGAVQNPHILKDVLGYPHNSRRTGNFYNGVVVNVKTYNEFTLKRPIVDRLDDIKKGIKERERDASLDKTTFYPPNTDELVLRGESLY